MKLPTFEEAWARKEAQGYLYGRDALEQIKLGWRMAVEALAPLVEKAGHYDSLCGRVAELEEYKAMYEGLCK